LDSTQEYGQGKYIQEKEKAADRLIDIVEKYLIPDLKKNIVVRDISTPARLPDYSGSPPVRFTIWRQCRITSERIGFL